MASLIPELNAKMLALLKEAVPKVTLFSYEFKTCEFNLSQALLEQVVADLKVWR